MRDDTYTVVPELHCKELHKTLAALFRFIRTRTADPSPYIGYSRFFFVGCILSIKFCPLSLSRFWWRQETLQYVHI